jgi:hypothetical protein
MINNYLCEKCGHAEVCKIMDILAKFHEDAKKPLGVNITMDQCSNYESDSDEKSGKDE